MEITQNLILTETELRLLIKDLFESDSKEKEKKNKEKKKFHRADTKIIPLNQGLPIGHNISDRRVKIRDVEFDQGRYSTDKFLQNKEDKRLERLKKIPFLKGNGKISKFIRKMLALGIDVTMISAIISQSSFVNDIDSLLLFSEPEVKKYVTQQVQQKQKNGNSDFESLHSDYELFGEDLQDIIDLEKDLALKKKAQKEFDKFNKDVEEDLEKIKDKIVKESKSLRAAYGFLFS